MKVFIEKENKHIKADASSVEDLLKGLDINPATVILVRNGEVILEDEILEDSDDIKILSVVSGG